MDIDSPLHASSRYQHMLLVAQAKREAPRLRRDAIAAFCSDLARAVASALPHRLQGPAAPSRKTAACRP
jgi:hypothetical protein